MPLKHLLTPLLSSALHRAKAFSAAHPISEGTRSWKETLLGQRTPTGYRDSLYGDLLSIKLGGEGKGGVQFVFFSCCYTGDG